MARDTSKYWIDGRRRISVTEILEGAGFQDIGRIPQRILQPRAIFGTEVHDMVKRDVAGTPQTLVKNTALWWCRQRWHEFLVDYHPRILISETFVYNRTLDYVGTPDLLLWFDLHGLQICVDIKTGTGYYPAYAYQTALYDLAGADMGLFRRSDDRAILHLWPRGYELRLISAEPTFISHDLDYTEAASAAVVANARLRHGLLTIYDKQPKERVNGSEVRGTSTARGLIEEPNAAERALIAEIF